MTRYRRFVFILSLFGFLLWFGNTSFAQPVGSHRTFAPLVQARPVLGIGYELLLLSNRDGTTQMNLYTQRTDGNPPIRVSTMPVSTAQWSPTEDKILFSSRGESYTHLYLINSDGSDLALLADLPGNQYNAAWSPDGKYVAFLSNNLDSPLLTLYIWSADSNTLLTVANSILLPELAWSPDSSALAFSADALPDDPALRLEVFVYTLTTATTRQLTNGTVGYRLSGWVEQGKRLLVQSDYSDDRADLFTVELEGGDLHQLSTTLGKERVHAISEDGSQIAYSPLIRHESFATLYDHTLTNADPSFLSAPFCLDTLCGLEKVAFSPNQERVVYVTWEQISAFRIPSQLWVARTNSPEPQWENLLTDVHAPFWLDDQTLIVHRSDESSLSRFRRTPYVYDLTTGVEVPLSIPNETHTTVIGVRYNP